MFSTFVENIGEIAQSSKIQLFKVSRIPEGLEGLELK